MISAVLATLWKAIVVFHILAYYLVTTYAWLLALALLAEFALLWRIDRTWSRPR